MRFLHHRDRYLSAPGLRAIACSRSGAAFKIPEIKETGAPGADQPLRRRIAQQRVQLSYSGRQHQWLAQITVGRGFSAFSYWRSCRGAMRLSHHWWASISISVLRRQRRRHSLSQVAVSAPALFATFVFYGVMHLLYVSEVFPVHFLKTYLLCCRLSAALCFSRPASR